MKILLTSIILLLLSLPAFADQSTTILEEKVTLGKIATALPYIDGSNDVVLEKQANALIRETASTLAKKAGGSVNYRVTLNRPSLLGILLTASAGEKTFSQGLNLDLTTGKEFSVTDFFVDNDAVRAALPDYERVLFAEEGLLVQKEKFAPYDALVPYSEVLSQMRIGEAGRIMQIAKLTAAAADKTLIMEKPGLIALKLQANPSTGYSWDVAADNKAMSKVGSSFTIPREEEARVGTPGWEFLFLHLSESGDYKIKLSYKRPWEKISLDSFSFAVVVR